jgi:hypothetical protein
MHLVKWSLEDKPTSTVSDFLNRLEEILGWHHAAKEFADLTAEQASAILSDGTLYDGSNELQSLYFALKKRAGLPI